MLLVAAVREELGDLPGEPLGVGPVVAAARAASALERHRPDAVVLIGSAGSYSAALPLGRAIAARRVALGCGVEELGLGYRPRPPAMLDTCPQLCARLGLPAHDVLTVPAITTDPALAARFGQRFAVEHLEAYGLAFAAAERGIPFAIVLGIANRVGPDAHAEWLAHRDRAQRSARRAVEVLLG